MWWVGSVLALPLQKFFKIIWFPEKLFIYLQYKEIKVMKALQNIQNEAKQIVEQLADRQINNRKERYNEFLKWIKVEGGAIMANYGDGIDMYQTAHKYIFMTQFKRYNRELGQFELPVAYPSDYRGRNGMNYNKELMFQVFELRLQIQGNWETRYREDFIGQNMVHKLFTTVHDFFCKKGWRPERWFVYLPCKIDKKIKLRL